jgi:hypothetical protein
MKLLLLDEFAGIRQGGPNVLVRDTIFRLSQVGNSNTKQHDRTVFQPVIGHRDVRAYGDSIPSLRIERYWS